QALTPEQRALALTVQGLVLGQDLGLVPGRVAPGSLRPLGDLRVRNLIAHRISMRHDGPVPHGGHAGRLLPRPLSSMIRYHDLPHQRLTQRGLRPPLLPDPEVLP